MRKVIKYSDKQEYIRSCITTLCALRDINLSDSESAMMGKLISYSENNGLTLDVNLSRQMRDELKMSQSSFNTAIHRLEQKKCLTKESKGIILNPVFNRITEWKELVIRFELLEADSND